MISIELLIEELATGNGLLVGVVALNTGESVIVIVILLILLVGSSTVLLYTILLIAVSYSVTLAVVVMLRIPFS